MSQKPRSLIIYLLSLLLASISMYSRVYADVAPQLGKAPLAEVIAAMTLEEKALLVVGTGMDLPPGLATLRLPEDEALFTDEKSKKVYAEYKTMVEKIKKLVPGAAGRTPEITRLGIPTMVLADGPAGLRIRPQREDDPDTYYATAFPIATLLASTWDTELVHKVGQAMGNEVLEYGVDTILGPGMNLHRNPLCGRNFEYYSEDPFVTGKIAAAMVKGIQSQGVGACLKHFAANNQETNRNFVDTIVGERALRELYLEGFRIAVEEARPWTVMSAYNRLNGIFASENHDLLTKTLRHDWDFNGYVMTDWGAGSDTAARMTAGSDLIMPGNINQVWEIVTSVRDKRLDEQVLDRNVESVLSVILKTPRFKRYTHSDKPDLKAHADVTRQAAADGMVLLKNNHAALPMGDNIKTIAVFGNTSYQIITGGTGSGDVNEAYSVSLIEGLTNSGYSIDDSLRETYVNYLKEAKSKQPKRTGIDAMLNPLPPIPEMKIDAAISENLADNSDIALITIGRNSGEGGDRNAEAGDFYLTDTEKTVIGTVTQAFQAKGKKAIVILNIGGVIETKSWRDFPDAILLVWQGGQETGNSIADVISGKVNPSGKLTCTFPNSYDDVPSAKNFPGIELPRSEGDVPPSDDSIASLSFMRRIPSEVVYEEGIYVGYRYYDTFNVSVAYEFGYGLSYTQFEYRNIRLSSNEFRKNLTIEIDVKNTGKTAGREVVQVYLSAPGKTLDKPVKELKAFGKTGLLKPGETEILTFVIEKRSLASFDTASSSWVAEAGTYEVKIGASSKDIRQKSSFRLDKALLVKKESRALTPKRTIKRLAPGVVY